MSQGSFLEALKTYLQRLTQQKPSAEAEESSIDPALGPQPAAANTQ